MCFRRYVLNLVASLSILGLVFEPAKAQDVLQGAITSVRDGDTIEVAGQLVRLWGLHVPERDEPGGLAASRVLTALVGQHLVRCNLTGAKSRDRMIGRCWVADNPLLITQPQNPSEPTDPENLYDLAGIMILLGVARDCPRFSHGYYTNLEQSWAKEEMPLPSYCEDQDTKLQADVAFWNSISDSNDPQDYKRYLATFHDGQFSVIARRRAKVEEQDTQTSALPSLSDIDRLNGEWSLRTRLHSGSPRIRCGTAVIVMEIYSGQVRGELRLVGHWAGGQQLFSGSIGSGSNLRAQGDGVAIAGTISVDALTVSGTWDSSGSGCRGTFNGKKRF